MPETYNLNKRRRGIAGRRISITKNNGAGNNVEYWPGVQKMEEASSRNNNGKSSNNNIPVISVAADAAPATVPPPRFCNQNGGNTATRTIQDPQQAIIIDHSKIRSTTTTARTTTSTNLINVGSTPEIMENINNDNGTPRTSNVSITGISAPLGVTIKPIRRRRRRNTSSNSVTSNKQKIRINSTNNCTAAVERAVEPIAEPTRALTIPSVTVMVDPTNVPLLSVATTTTTTEKYFPPTKPLTAVAAAAATAFGCSNTGVGCSSGGRRQGGFVGLGNNNNNNNNTKTKKTSTCATTKIPRWRKEIIAHNDEGVYWDINKK
jgi:hypothetical protein